MTVVVAVLGVLIVIALFFILALLRSHAEILRRLAAIESSLDAGQIPASAAAAAPVPAGGLATAIQGQTLAGEPATVRFEMHDRPTLLAFMGTGCQVCAPLWQELHGDPVPTPAGARLVVVTKGPERERLARLLELAPAETDVVMSTQAWSDFAVAATPHFVLVRDGRIAGRGSATSWEQITTFLTDAADDDRLYRARALDTNARAARAEQALADAGIGPEHPSLYPSRETQDD
jgi:hypothetical protein